MTDFPRSEWQGGRDEGSDHLNTHPAPGSPHPLMTHFLDGIASLSDLMPVPWWRRDPAHGVTKGAWVGATHTSWPQKKIEWHFTLSEELPLAASNGSAFASDATRSISRSDGRPVTDVSWSTDSPF
ncbi:hypothetical protein NDU88_003604 [Pleurodeles waltl]|uniref:Uncharacterized protein n=1 Tax=Pleurodeles waltl TaxID=8319 RepID=A0AAV7VG43_PLEWA|nr:hypothetical protein NDU88_003604 [Pleurodeles waltl]